MSVLFGIWHGPEGLKAIASRIRYRAEILLYELESLCFEIISDKDNFFDTITFDCHASDLSSADQVIAEFHKYGINLRKVNEN